MNSCERIGRLKIYTQEAPLWFNATKVWIVEERKAGELYLAELTFKKLNEGTSSDVPTLHLGPDELRDWMETLRLNHEGIRTDNDFKIQGTLAATKYHLEDMRKLAFDSIKKNK